MNTNEVSTGNGNNEEVSIYAKAVAAVMALLKLDDAGVVSKYIKAQVKDLERQIAGIKMKAANFKFVNSETLVILDEDIESAEGAVDISYINVDVEAIKENSREYMAHHSEVIDEAEQALVTLKKRKENLEKEIAETLEGYKKDTIKLENRLAKVLRK